MDANRSLQAATTICLLCVAAAGSGCVAVAAGAAAGYAGYEYSNGECVGVAAGTVDKLYRATLAAADQMQMTVKSKSRELNKASFTLRQPDGTAVDLWLSRQSADFTRITVRVGTFGDEARSRQIIAKIKENL